jgi:uncharacterized protein involved in tellurium resistance
VISHDPSSARRRTDLGWLRHRTARQVAARAPSAAVPTPAPDPVRRSRARPTTSDLDLSDPGPPPPVPAGTAGSLDLFPPSPTAAVEPGSGALPGSADLARPSRAGSPVPPVSASGRPRRPVPRVASRGRVILTRQEPTVTLNRVQSGVGSLTVEAVCSPAVGDITLGALYQLTDGTSSVVHRATGLGSGPPRSRRPVLTASRGEFEQLLVDLRQSRTLERLLVYAVSESGSELAWGGTLVTRTFGESRVELPLDFGRHRGPIALMSLYNVDGEYVLRAEAEKVTGAVRDVARSFGYDQITWADPRTPVV